MHARILCIAILASGLAGCTTSAESPMGSFEVAIMDDAPVATSIAMKGAWIRTVGDGNWATVIPANTTVDLTGAGSNVTQTMQVAAGGYDAVRFVIESVDVDGKTPILAQSGFELPLGFAVTDGGVTTFSFTLGWGDSVFESADGLAFQPVLVALRVIQDGVEIISLQAQEIEVGPTKPPVARMRIFEESGFPVYQSDFVAESLIDPVVGRAGMMVLTGSDSEAIEQGATLETFEWFVNGEPIGSGKTVSHAFPLAGGNFTVRLEVTDSLGVTDGLSIPLALAPGFGVLRYDFNGTVTGFYVTSVSGNRVEYQDGDGGFEVPVEVESFMGSPARVAEVRGAMNVVSSSVGVFADVDFAVLDGSGSRVGGGSTSPAETSNQEEFTKTYAHGAAQPAAGNWTFQVTAGATAGSTYEGALVVTYQGVNPGMDTFLALYSDGHTHCHVGIDEC